MKLNKLLHRKSKRAQASSLLSIENDELLKIAVIFETLDKFRKGGLIHIDMKRKTVTISSVLSNFFLYDDEQWQNFLHQCHLWATYEFSVEAYRRAFSKTLADAEAKANKENGVALDYDQRRVVRMQAAEAFDADKEVEKCPDLNFVVIGATEDNKPLLVARYLDGRYKTLSVHEIKSSSNGS